MPPACVMQACFSIINVTAPNDAQLKRIFGTLLNFKLTDFDDAIKPLGDQITQGTIEIYRAVSRELLPTPSKSHYLFNTRDLAKIIQGVMQASKTFYDNQVSVEVEKHQSCTRMLGPGAEEQGAPRIDVLVPSWSWTCPAPQKWLRG